MPFSNEAFDPDVLKAMSAAYEKACVTIKTGPHADVAREIVAKRIIGLARQGYSDADKLCAEALKELGLPRTRPDGGRPPLSPTAQ